MMHMARRSYLRASALICGCLLMVSLAAAGDWPQIMGPQRDGRAAADEKLADFPAGPPATLWKRPVGEGYAGPAVADGVAYIFHRVDDRDLLEALDAATGKQKWKFDYATDYRDGFGFDNGPRAVPTVHAGRVYIHGAQGLVHCVDAATGRMIWRVETAKQYRSPPGFFGRACSPLVVGDVVVLNIGGAPGMGIIALDAATGDLRWKATDHQASYSSPATITIDGKQRVAVFTREGLVLLDPVDGRVLLSQQWRSPIDASVNAAVPLVVGDTLVLTAAYDTGAIALRLDAGGGAGAGGAAKRWSGDDAISSHFGTPVHHEGLLFGFHGRQDIPPPAELRCIELATGKVRWTAQPRGVGHIILVDGRLVVLMETGELLIAPASGDAFKPVAQVKVLDHGIRAYPALSNGVLFARDEKQLVAARLTP